MLSVLADLGEFHKGSLTTSSALEAWIPAVRVCKEPGKALGARVRRDRLQLSTGQAGEGESKTWEEKQSEQPGCPYPRAASFTPCFPTAMRALPAHPPIQRLPEHSLPALLTTLTFFCIYRPTRGYFSPYLQLPEPGSALAERDREQCQLPSASPSASVCSAFSAAEFSCNFLVPVRGSAQKSALGSERQDTLRAGGSHGLWGSWCPALGLPASWAAPDSHLAIWLLSCC